MTHVISFILARQVSFEAAVTLDLDEWRALFGTDYSDASVTEAMVQEYIDHTKHPVSLGTMLELDSKWYDFEEDDI